VSLWTNIVWPLVGSVYEYGTLVEPLELLTVLRVKRPSAVTLLPLTSEHAVADPTSSAAAKRTFARVIIDRSSIGVHDRTMKERGHGSAACPII
jgi:hypothetical protein